MPKNPPDDILGEVMSGACLATYEGFVRWDAALDDRAVHHCGHCMGHFVYVPKGAPRRMSDASNVEGLRIHDLGDECFVVTRRHRMVHFSLTDELLGRRSPVFEDSDIVSVTTTLAAAEAALRLASL
jgi:hypothetical protein